MMKSTRANIHFLEREPLFLIWKRWTKLLHRQKYTADGLSIDHNLYVIGDYVFQANYKRGLRILRINDPATADLTEVAYFDTYPISDGLGFEGAWNVFPFFQNNLLLISDINRGLFVVRVTDSDLALSLERVFEDRFDN